jgi:hypothetical protein
MKTCFNYFSHDTHWYHKKKNKIKIGGQFGKWNAPQTTQEKFKKLGDTKHTIKLH